MCRPDGILHNASQEAVYGAAAFETVERFLEVKFSDKGLLLSLEVLKFADGNYAVWSRSLTYGPVNSTIRRQ